MTCLLGTRAVDDTFQLSRECHRVNVLISYRGIRSNGLREKRDATEMSSRNALLDIYFPFKVQSREEEK